MGYKLRDQAPGFHHVVMRGNNKRDIFRDDDDDGDGRDLFLFLLDRVARREGWAIYAYALMTNHFHLVLHIEESGLATGMCRLSTEYATQYNRANGRINHLFGKRYWSERLATERRLFATIRYVVRNPRRAGFEGPLESHTWTSYAATIGLALSRVQLAKDQLLSMLSPDPARAIEKFRELCEAPDPEGPDRWQPP